MSRLIDEYTRNKSPEDKKEVERRVREMAGTMSELSALMLVLEEMRQEGKAGGGRIGYQEGTKPKINFDLDFAKSGKNQVTGAPEGITAEDQYLSAVVNLDLPITEKIGLLAEYAVNKDRRRFEYDDSELQGGLFKGDSERKKIGLRYGNESDQGITGSIMLDPDTKDYMAGIKFSKKFAKGGRIGFKGGADMGTVSTPTRAATAKSVSISPTGGVTTSRDKGPDPVDDRSSFEQTMNQRNIVDRSKEPKKSLFKNLYDAGQEFNYLRNLAIGNFPGIGKQLLFDLGKRKFLDYQTMLNEDGIVNGLPENQFAELSQKQLDFLNSPKIQRDLKEFDREPKAIFDQLPDYEERRPTLFNPLKKQEPTTSEEFNEYLDSIGVKRMTVAEGGRIGLAEGTKKFMFNDVLREPMSELEKMSVGNPGTKEMYASEIREMLAQNRDEAKVKIPKKKKKQKPLKIDLEKIKKLIQKAKAREGAADGGIGYLLGE